MSLPNYEHRTPADLKEFDVIALEDSIAILTEQAEAVILMMQTQFISKDSQVNTAKTNFSALECIRKDLLDIKVLVGWFSEKEIKGGKS